LILEAGETNFRIGNARPEFFCSNLLLRGGRVALDESVGVRIDTFRGSILASSRGWRLQAIMEIHTVAMKLVLLKFAKSETKK
jgi:hypothetical protein